MTDVQLNETKRYAIYVALTGQATRNRQDARKRANAGPELACVRKVLRDNAEYYDQLAERIWSERGTDAGYERAERRGQEPCEVEGCERKALKCKCGAAHCPDHPHIY